MSLPQLKYRWLEEGLPETVSDFLQLSFDGIEEPGKRRIGFEPHVLHRVSDIWWCWRITRGADDTRILAGGFCNRRK